MNFWQALILGVVEGVTEYLPVSSTGHLLVTQEILGLRGQDREAADAFAICIQGGAILAVLGLYFSRVKQMLGGLFGGDAKGRQLFVGLVVAFGPAVVLGLIFDDWISEKLFGTWPVVFAWIAGGLGILVVAKWLRKKGGTHGGKGLEEMDWKMALGIGLLQCAAMWPGTSRSLMTIVGGVLVGLSLAAAVEFSFLLGVLTLGAATCYRAVGKAGPEGGPHDQWGGGLSLMLGSYGAFPLIVGSVAAFLSAALAVKWMVSYLNNHGMEIFGYYRVVLGLVIGSLLLAGVLQN